MKNDLNYLFYYVYAITILAGTSYIVFALGYSGLWFILALLLLDNKPR